MTEWNITFWFKYHDLINSCAHFWDWNFALKNTFQTWKSQVCVNILQKLCHHFIISKVLKESLMEPYTSITIFSISPSLSHTDTFWQLVLLFKCSAVFLSPLHLLDKPEILQASVVLSCSLSISLTVSLSLSLSPLFSLLRSIALMDCQGNDGRCFSN